MSPGQPQKQYLYESPEYVAASLGLPQSMAQPSMVTYRSVGIGIFGATMRLIGMPLEKIALFMNSSQVAGKGQFAQAVKLTFQEGYLAPYRVVGKASMTAWFLQYSVMGVAFQFFDHGISQLLGVKPVWYGKELMEPAVTEDRSFDYKVRSALARITSPMLAACLESSVSNRAEAQRFFGPKESLAMEKKFGLGLATRTLGPAFLPNAMRNVIMCQTSFLLTPITYKLYFPQEQKNKATLFWYGLTMNIFIGNVVAITQQALWGRSLDYFKEHGKIEYRKVVQQGLQKDGMAAFFTGPKWFSRVLMNAPAQGTLPWFYNEVLPLGERTALTLVKTCLYDTFLKDSVVAPENSTRVPLQRRRSSLGSLATAHPEFIETSDDEDDVTVKRHTTKELKAFSSAHSEFKDDAAPAALTANSPR
jgi:hypothetical protein